MTTKNPNILMNTVDVMLASAAPSIPIVGINSGRLGFLADIAQEEIESAIEHIFKGNYKTNSLDLIQLHTENDLFGDMNFALVEKIASQLPPNIMVQLHNNGEGLLYPRFGDAAKLFNRQTTNIVTNGKLLVEKADEIIDNLDTLAV